MSQYIYRMSSLGGCVKAIAAAQLGYQPLPTKEETEELFEEGHRLENVVVERLYKEFGITVGRQQQEVNIPISSSVLLQGHIDGQARANNPPYSGPSWRDVNKVVEIKSMRPTSFNSLLAHGWESPGFLQKYKWQTSGYMFGTGLELALVVIDSDPEIEDDYERRIHFLYQEVPFYSLEEIRARVLTAHQWVVKGELPSACNVNQFSCPFAYLHEDETNLLEDGQIDTLAREYKAAQRNSKAATEKEKEIYGALVRQSELKGKKSGEDKDLNGELVTFNKEKLQTMGGVTISRWEQKNPGHLALDRMAEDGIDLDKYRVQSKSWRMRVTIKGEKEENEQ